MKFNLTIDIPDDVLESHLEFLKGSKGDPQTMRELIGEINNCCYLGLDCTTAIIFRKLSGLECDSYVEKQGE